MQPPKKRRSIDGFITTPAKPKVLPHLQPRAVNPQPVPPPHFQPSQPSHTHHAQPEHPRPTPPPHHMPQPVTEPEPARRSLPKRLLLGIGKFMLGLGIFIFAFLAQSPAFGQIAIFIYAIAAFIWHISSRTTFTMAVMALGLVLFASIRSDVTLAGTFAIYAFLLLIVGTLTLWREVRSEI